MVGLRRWGEEEEGGVRDRGEDGGFLQRAGHGDQRSTQQEEQPERDAGPPGHRLGGGQDRCRVRDLPVLPGNPGPVTGLLSPGA